MAEKKTTKKTATKEAKEVLSLEQMQANLAEKQNDYLEAKRSHAAGELANPRVLTHTRKEIARLSTAIRAAELAADKESN